MDSLFERAWRSLKTPAEDPRRVLPDVHERQLALLGAVRRAQETVLVTCDQLEARARATRKRLPALDGQARSALAGGRDDLARAVLLHREVAAAELTTLEGQAVELKDKEQRLGLLEERLTSEIEALLEREDMLAARHSAAAVQVRINESLAGVAQELAGLDLMLEQTEMTTEQLEARAAVIDRMTGTGGLDDPDRLLEELVERRLPGIDLSAAVEERLKVLAEEVASG